ncbi:MAG: glycosyltransferase family 4 protein [Methanobacteriota archaeon]
MKIAMIGWEYPPFKVGGLGTHCYGLTHGLADKGIQIDFYMPKIRNKIKSDKKNINIIEVGETEIFPYDRPDDKSLGGKFFEKVYKYNELLVSKVKGKYNAVHCHDWLTMKAGIQIKEKLGIPLIVTVHSTEYDRAGWLYPNQWFIDIEREGMEKADRVIAVSNFTKQVIVEKYGINPDKISVVHNAVYPIGGGEKKNLVLFLGRLTLQKGPEFFLKAAKKVLEHEDTHFVIAGTGDMLPRLINQAVDMGISSKVIFTGKLTDEEVRHIYKISSVYVMPSVSEPFGITALEACSAGTPTIVSKSSGVSEVFHNCFKVDFWDTDEMANKIISIIRYQPLRETMMDYSKQEINLFTWDRVADRTLDVYNEVAR